MWSQIDLNLPVDVICAEFALCVAKVHRIQLCLEIITKLFEKVRLSASDIKIDFDAASPRCLHDNDWSWEVKVRHAKLRLLNHLFSD